MNTRAFGNGPTDGWGCGLAEGGLTGDTESRGSQAGHQGLESGSGSCMGCEAVGAGSMTPGR